MSTISSSTNDADPTPVSRRELTQYCRYGLLNECFVQYADGRGDERTAKILGYRGDADDPLLLLQDVSSGESCSRWGSEVKVFRVRGQVDEREA